MLCASFSLIPSPSTTLFENAQLSDEAAPAQRLDHVHFCVASPPVTEEWVDGPHTPCLLTGEEQRQNLSSSPCVSLSQLTHSYTFASTHTGGTVVQVYAVGEHSVLSEETKAVVAGAMTAALRVELMRLLRAHEKNRGAVDPSRVSSCVEDGAVLRRCCSYTTSAALTASSPTAVPYNTRGAGGAWRITWLPELVVHVAASLSRAQQQQERESKPQQNDQLVHTSGSAPALTVRECAAWLRSSVEKGLRTRLRQDLGDEAEHVVRHQSSCAELAVRLVSCRVVHTHPLDAATAVELTALLYTKHVRPAQEHVEDGTEMFQELLTLSAPPRHGESTSAVSPASPSAAAVAVQDVYERAVAAYEVSGRCAQSGVLYTLTHHLSAHRGAPLTPLTAAEERARLQVAAWEIATEASSLVAQITAEKKGNVQAEKRVEDVMLAPLRMRGGGDADVKYFNTVLLTQAWNAGAALAGNDGTAENAGRLYAQLKEDVALNAARAALAWRDGFDDAQIIPVHRREGEEEKSATLSATPLQWVLYTLRRQLIVAVANAAQVVLTRHRQHPRTHPSSSSCSSSECSPSAARTVEASVMRDQADRCVKAQAMLRGLIKWHCPFPAPWWCCRASDKKSDAASTGSGTVSATALPPSAAAELLWCLRMLAKLHVRAAALYACVSDVARQQEQQRQWQDQMQRWRTRRRWHAAEVEVAEGSASVEDVVGHLDDAAWASFEQEVAAAGAAPAPR